MGKKGKRENYQNPEYLVKWAGTRNPSKIAKKRQFAVIEDSKPDSNLPGFTCFVGNFAEIHINLAYFERLKKENPYYTDEDIENDKRQVIAHELGHASLHRKEAALMPYKTILEFSVFDDSTRMETEANEFASIILIDKDELLSYRNEGLSYLEVARLMRVNVNLLMYRIQMLRREGYEFNDLPYLPKNNFMGHIEGCGSPEWGE